MFFEDRFQRSANTIKGAVQVAVAVASMFYFKYPAQYDLSYSSLFNFRLETQL